MGFVSSHADGVSAHDGLRSSTPHPTRGLHRSHAVALNAGHLLVCRVCADEGRSHKCFVLPSLARKEGVSVRGSGIASCIAQTRGGQGMLLLTCARCAFLGRSASAQQPHTINTAEKVI